MDDARFRALHALRVKGMTSAAVAAAVVAAPEAEIAAALDDLGAEGLVRHRSGGRIEGWSLTKDGKAAHAELVAGSVDPTARTVLEQAYEDFLPLNGEFKTVCHAWQTRGDGDTPNDHTDAAHDEAVVARLGAVDERAGAVLSGVGAALDRMSAYRPRLAAALERVRAGERSAFTAPMQDSYHDIWMELHQDLILSLGRTRNTADEGASPREH
ncbi:hypothetical protein [Actinomycetospora chiangmaiensis]|uniref:hypothetical protein n=1 Tax=Actinomycetospora chiangmaiensis TaxID=402650 RepID=UPI000377D039|nr:hypothetical protein [Actinomycetospora chiangmaiensis]